MSNDELIIYNNIILEDKLKEKQNILIDNKMLIHENINIKNIPKFDQKIEDKYGLSLKFINLIKGLNITNELICVSNELFDKIKKKRMEIQIFNTYNIAKLNKLNEYIIYDIKKYIDEIIATTWILKQDELVDTIKIKSIGDYLNDIKVSSDFYEYKKFIDYFELVNNLDNAYKHSFSNSLTPDIIGNEKNCITVLYAKYGKRILEPQTIYIFMDDLILMFNDFYNYSFKLINSYNKSLT